MEDSFSNRLASLLENQHLNAGKLSFELKKTPQQIQNYLKGKSQPTVDVVTGIVNITKCDGHWLLTGIGNMFDRKEEHSITQIGSTGTDNKGSISFGFYECKEQIATLKVEVGYLKQQVADRDRIIRLMEIQLQKE